MNLRWTVIGPIVLAGAISSCNSNNSQELSGTTQGTNSGQATSCQSAALSFAPSQAIEDLNGQYLETAHAMAGSPLKKLAGHIPHMAAQMKDAGALDESQELSFTVGLSLNDSAGLDQELTKLYDPTSSKYHQFLSGDEFRTKYSPTTEQVDGVKDYLNSQGITVTAVNDNRTLISSKASIAAINSALHTELHQYQDSLGTTYFAPAFEPQIDSSVPIQAFLGLQNMVVAKNHLVERHSVDGDASAHTSAIGVTPAMIRAAYNLPSSVTGSGQTLALFELDGYVASDVAAYEKKFSLPKVTLQNVLVEGSKGKAGAGADEVTLDIELMIAVAPGAHKIMVYEGVNTEMGVLATYDKIASDNIAKEVSTSWGETEATGSYVQSENTIFKQMSAQGQSIFAASGDVGAKDNGSTLSVNDPASQPYVVAVGGTKLKTNSTGAYTSETTWDESAQSAGGGGISTVWTIPSWQVGVVSPPSKGSLTMRNVPDVSLNADPETGYAIYVNASWLQFGGTSCAAPIWAAYTALVNEKRVSAGLSDLGFPNPSLYTIGKSKNYSKAFHDIQDGSTNQFYPAVTGFDDATGWGSFNGENLLQELSTDNLGIVASSCSS